MLNDNKYYPPSFFKKFAQTESKHWWFKSRNKILLHSIENYIGDFDNFLEVGCGTGFVLNGINIKYPNAKLTGAEFFEEGLIYARERVPNANFIQLDATQMTNCNKYNVIGAFDVIGHIKEDQLVIDNFFNGLKDKGNVIITVPQHKFMWSIVDEYALHERRYSRNEIIQKLKKSGFKIKYVTSFVSLLFPLMWVSRKIGSKKEKFDPMREFEMNPIINLLFEVIMKFEFFLLKLGINFPFGGSLLIIGQK